jgi:hypothetical protein
MGIAGFSPKEIGKTLHRGETSCKQMWKKLRPRSADGSIQTLTPDLSDTDFDNIAHMRKSGASWQDVQRSIWPDQSHMRVREAFENSCAGRLNECRLLKKRSVRRVISDDEFDLIERMRKERDWWDTISCVLYPESPPLWLGTSARPSLKRRLRKSLGT